MQRDYSAVIFRLLTPDEDRILAFEIAAAKRPCRWKLSYVESSYAITDTPETIIDLISQRRRWLNGR